jgi:hypothetical protein
LNVLRAQVFHLLLGRLLQIHGTDPGLYHRAEMVKYLANDAAALPHLLNLCRRFTDNRHAYPP